MADDKEANKPPPQEGRPSKRKASSPDEKAEMDKAIEEANKQIVWSVVLFLLCSSAGIFNAFHILAVNFITETPAHWCSVPELKDAHWTPEQIREISAEKNTVEENCNMIGWNYSMLSEMGYEKAKEYVNKTTPKPDKVACSSFIYNTTSPDIVPSVVVQWDLVCNKKFQKSNVQGSIAIGKFAGGLVGGFFADKYGRRITFLICAVVYFVSAVYSALTTSFTIFLICRFFTGSAGAAAYETSFTILAELVNKKRRVGLGCMFNITYPVGYIVLALLSLVFKKWRYLMMVISAPMVIFLVHFWLLPESPRWLLVTGKPDKAWKTIKKINKNYEPQLPLEPTAEPRSSQPTNQEPTTTAAAKHNQLQEIIEGCKEVLIIFSTCELCKRLFITAFVFFVASLVYYVLAQNASNFGIGQVEYTIFSGLFEIPGYIAPIFVMMCMGRKVGSMMLFFLSGLLLILITGLPKDQNILILSLAMVGRFLNVVVFALVIVYCAELFPTEVRNAAIGLAVTWSQMGSILSPYIVNIMGPIAWYLPSLVCGVFALVSAAMVMMLPETRGKKLPDTIEDVKKQTEDRVSLWNCCRFS